MFVFFIFSDAYEVCLCFGCCFHVLFLTCMLVFGFLCCDRCLLLFVAFFSLLQEVKVIVHGWLCFASYAMAFWFISFWSWKPKSPFFLFACFSISSCELFFVLMYCFYLYDHIICYILLECWVIKKRKFYLFNTTFLIDQSVFLRFKFSLSHFLNWNLTLDLK